MRKLTMDEMANIAGGGSEPGEGALECAMAGLGFFLSAATIGLAITTGPYGWAMGSFLIANAGVNYYSFVNACSS